MVPYEWCGDDAIERSVSHIYEPKPMSPYTIVNAVSSLQVSVNFGPHFKYPPKDITFQPVSMKSHLNTSPISTDWYIPMGNCQNKGIFLWYFVNSPSNICNTKIMVRFKLRLIHCMIESRWTSHYTLLLTALALILAKTLILWMT